MSTDKMIHFAGSRLLSYFYKENAPYFIVTILLYSPFVGFDLFCFSRGVCVRHFDGMLREKMIELFSSIFRDVDFMEW